MSVQYPPALPPASGVSFPDPNDADSDSWIAVGTDFSPGTLLTAYASGIFPWPHSLELVPWCSPDPRAIFPLKSEPHWSRSLVRRLRTHSYRVSVDEAFVDVMRACGHAREGHTWILPEMLAGYRTLHELGWAHSVEVWEGTELVGGIYGIAVGLVFAGESMFHTRTDASKIAFAELVNILRARGYVLFDVQVQNPHLESLGCVEISREAFLRVHARAREATPPKWPSGTLPKRAR